MAYEQMNAERARAIALNACIDVVDLSRFACGSGTMIFARDAGQATVFVQFAAIGAAKGGVDEAVGKFSGLLRHLGCGGRANQSQNHWRPAQWCPLAAVARRLCQRLAPLFNLVPISP